ncbi:patatin-like phospholipase family protein [Lachnoclostridium phytofermentans]|jgi:predicted patatin/cPLA2 family phospholipase|uniref:patatin-like phospholipase family protein n=1 Tax=Lachnoclostridium phytofermentans TaxID=66219 RepID=UPI00049683B9|nr:patatin family protein [Lachnoclostridium phytofermentans]
MIEGALVLEGGSLRCLFTAGVLDVLMEHGIELSYVNGVSAGSMCGLNYVSKQIGRTKDINLNYVNDKRYLGVHNLFRHGGIFNFDFLFSDITDHLHPFDKEEFLNSKQRFTAIATNCQSGEAEFFEKDSCANGSCDEIFLATRASSSMPMLSKMVKIQEEYYLDGGIALPIAYQKALEEGYQKVIVVLTREAGYQKSPEKRSLFHAYEKLYSKYPKLLEKLHQIPQHYNEMQKEIEQLEKEGRIYVIRPQHPITIKRLEKDIDKLEELYKRGRNRMEEDLDRLKDYLDMI